MNELKAVQPCLLSIAICTRNRAQLLYECLKALHGQLVDMHDVQVLVVDNGSTDDTRRVLADFSSRFPHWLGVKEPEVGLSHARNQALASTGADWIAFLDDDAKPLAGYVSRLKALASEGSFDCVAGVYLPWYRDGRKPWFRDSYASNVSSIQRFGDLPVGIHASGGNFLLRKQAALDAGGFRSELGMAGSRRAYGEETRLQIELRRKGRRIGGDPELLVEHLTAMPKQSLCAILHSAWSVGRDHWATFDEYPTAGVMLGRVRRLLSRPLLALYKELFRQSERCSWQSVVLAIGRPLVMTFGELSEGMRLIFGRRQ